MLLYLVCVIGFGCSVIHGSSRQILENCRNDFTHHIGVGLEPLMSCLIANRQFTYLMTAVKPGLLLLYVTFTGHISFSMSLAAGVNV